MSSNIINKEGQEFFLRPSRSAKLAGRGLRKLCHRNGVPVLSKVCVNGNTIGEIITSDKTEFVTLVEWFDRRNRRQHAAFEHNVLPSSARLIVWQTAATRQHGREFINRDRKEQTQNLCQKGDAVASDSTNSFKPQCF